MQIIGVNKHENKSLEQDPERKTAHQADDSREPVCSRCYAKGPGAIDPNHRRVALRSAGQHPPMLWVVQKAPMRLFHVSHQAEEHLLIRHHAQFLNRRDFTCSRRFKSVQHDNLIIDLYSVGPVMDHAKIPGQV